METKPGILYFSSSLEFVFLALHLILFLLLNLSPPLIKTNKMHEKMYLFDVFALPPRRSTRGHGRISPTQLPPPAWLRLVQERRGRWTQPPPPPLRLIQPKKIEVLAPLPWQIMHNCRVQLGGWNNPLHPDMELLQLLNEAEEPREGWRLSPARGEEVQNNNLFLQLMKTNKIYKKLYTFDVCALLFLLALVLLTEKSCFFFVFHILYWSIIYQTVK